MCCGVFGDTDISVWNDFVTLGPFHCAYYCEHGGVDLMGLKSNP